MSYIALARKWRPQTFSELLGQEHLNNALINSLNKQRLHHAYLFTGTRGVGKTSVARLLAKSLNCEKGVSATPCLKCEACTAFADGRFLDLIEIDGASKTKVEDTRELLENVQYAPTVGRYKIYLIDEVHMLSQHSFNALLKTLEEPPSHVKFLLATTDPEKLPITVLSRCLQFSLRTVSEETISKHLADILDKEELKFELEALKILARAAKGSIRDSLSLLDQAIVGCDSHINTQDVKNLLGYTQQNYAAQILKALINKNPAELIKLSRQINTEGGFYSYVVDEILSHLHKIAINQALDGAINDSTEITNLSQQISAEDTQLLYQIALRAREDMATAPTAMIGFEILLLRMHTFALVNQNIDCKQSTKKSPLAKEQRIKKVDNSPTADIATEIELSSANWHTIIPNLNLSGLTLNAAENSEIINFNGHIVSLVTDKAHESLFNSSVIEKIEASLVKLYNKEIKIKLTSGDTPKTTPAKIKQEKASASLKKANDSLDNDDFFKSLQEEFSAELVKNSIASLKDDA